MRTSRFLGFAKSGREKWTEWTEKWTEMDSHFQEGYDADEPEIFYGNGQNGQEMDSHFQEGYETFERETKWTKWTEWTRNRQPFSGGIRTLLKK